MHAILRDHPLATASTDFNTVDRITLCTCCVFSLAFARLVGMMPADQLRPNMHPLTDTETGRTPERPTSLPLLQAVNTLVQAAGVQREFETHQLFNLLLERPNGHPLLLGSCRHIQPHSTEKRHVSVAPIVAMGEGSETEDGWYATEPDITLTETGQLLRVELTSGEAFHAYYLAGKEYYTLRTDISQEERQFAESTELAVAERLATPEWLEAALAYKEKNILHTTFTAVTISRATLIAAGISEGEAISLRDFQMEQLAARIGQACLEQGLLEAIRTQTRRLLDGVEEQP